MAREQAVYRLPDRLEGSILGQIVQFKIHELAGSKNKWPADAIRMALGRAPEVRSLKRSLATRPPGMIAELKKASPSAGVLRHEFKPVDIAAEYAAAGAAALSVVTEAGFFQGALETVARLRWSADLPLLRKDFILESYQLLESRHAGADAVLLIAALHDLPGLKRLCDEAAGLGMEVLVEVHDEEELERALAAHAPMVGVNNRNLTSFEVSLETGLKLGPLIPNDVTAVAESGIRSAEDIRRLSDAGFKGFLVGETLMRAPSPGSALAGLITGFVSGRRKAS